MAYTPHGCTFIVMTKRYHRVKEVLAEKGVSQYRLAKEIDVTYNAINSICNYKAIPRIDTLFKIAEALGVDVCELLVQNSKKPQPEDTD